LKDKKAIELRLAQKRFQRKLRSKEKRKAKRRSYQFDFTVAKQSLGNDTSYENIFEQWLPANLKYLLSCENSDFTYEKIIKNIPENNGVFKVPSQFTLIDNPKESYNFIKNILGALITQKYRKVNLDYSECVRLGLGAQVLLDIILKDVIKFFNRCKMSLLST
jgi:hypothetical protein